MNKLYVLALLLLLLASGCRAAEPDEYISVKEHEAPYAHRETTAPPVETEAPPPELRTVSRSSDLREAIQEMAMNGEESAQFLIKDYVGDVNADVKNVFNLLLSDSPKYNYAMDSINCELKRTQAGPVVKVDMKLRLTPKELMDIKTRLFPEPAMSEIYKAMRQQLSSFTIQVSGYTETDFAALLEEYSLHHPDQIVEAPGISAAVYPDRGSLRVVELHFVYRSDNDTLKNKKDEANAVLNVVSKQLSGVESAQELLEMLYKHLVPPIGYESTEDATVFSQTVEKKGSSKTMSSVVEYLCQKAGWSCEIVRGERDGAVWYWNRILDGDRWLHFDLHSAALSGQPPLLRSAEELEGYLWDPEQYPEPEPDAPIPTEDEEPAAPGGEEPASTAETAAPEMSSAEAETG